MSDSCEEDIVEMLPPRAKAKGDRLPGPTSPTTSEKWSEYVPLGTANALKDQGSSSKSVNMNVECSKDELVIVESLKETTWVSLAPVSVRAYRDKRALSP